jgi:hypothetical protein
MPCEGVLHVIEIKAQPFGFNNQLLDLTSEEPGTFRRCRGRQRGDDGTNTDMDLKQPLREQRGDYFMCCVRIDLQLGAQYTDRRKWVAGPHLPRNDGLACGVNNLFPEWRSRFESEPEWNQSSVLCHIIQWKATGILTWTSAAHGKSMQKRWLPQSRGAKASPLKSVRL